MKVLIIDDSLTARQSVRSALPRYEVVEAVDGVDGMRQLERHPDARLVLCDVNMPGMGGLEMLEAAQRSGSATGRTFVMLTTESEPEAMARARACGVKGWLLKPFKPESLAATVDKIAAHAGDR